jgi:hypothetical protein
MNFGDILRRIFEYCLRPGQGEIEQSESLTEVLLSGEASASASASETSGLWRVACCCGFERQAATAWQATEIAKLHVRAILQEPEQDHTWTIEEPPSNRE